LIFPPNVLRRTASILQLSLPFRNPGSMAHSKRSQATSSSLAFLLIWRSGCWEICDIRRCSCYEIKNDQ